MSYIITATILLGKQINAPAGLDRLLREKEIRLLRKDSENDLVVLDMRGDFDNNHQQVRWLCEKLVDAGILEFEIEHSY